MIIHYKQANSEKQAMLGFLPILEVSMSYLERASGFGSLHWNQNANKFTSSWLNMEFILRQG